MSTSTLPRILEAQKKAEDSRYYMLRANRHMSLLALNRIHEQLDNERSLFNARIKQESLDLRMELIRRAEEEKEVLLADSVMLHDVNVKVARWRKKRADDIEEQKARKREIKRRAAEKNKNKENNRFERRAPSSGEETNEKPQESSGARRASQFPVVPVKKASNDLDIYMRPNYEHPKREPKIKLDRDLIFPNARKPTLYRQLLMTRGPKREISRINEKSLIKLREKYRALAAAEESKSVETGPPEGLAPEDVTSTPYISSLAHFMYQVPEDSRQSHLLRMQRQLADTRGALRAAGPLLPPSDRLKQSLEECVRRRKKRTRKRPIPGSDRPTDFSVQAPDTAARSTTVRSGTEGKQEATRALEGKTEDAREEAKEEKPRETLKEGQPQETTQKPTTQVPSATEKAEVPGAEYSQASEESQLEQADDADISEAADNSSLTKHPATDQYSEVKDEESNDVKESTSAPLTKSLRPGLKGPVLTPIQSTEASPAPTREQTMAAKPSSEDEQQQLDPEVWQDVLNCRYIRGYDPPEMRVPSASAAEFIFGDSKSKEYDR